MIRDMKLYGIVYLVYDITLYDIPVYDMIRTALLNVIYVRQATRTAQYSTAMLLILQFGKQETNSCEIQQIFPNHLIYAWYQAYTRYCCIIRVP